MPKDIIDHGKTRSHKSRKESRKSRRDLQDQPGAPSDLEIEDGRQHRTVGEFSDDARHNPARISGNQHERYVVLGGERKE